jgi:hypothetical protein
MQLSEALESVTDASSFLVFVRMLATDRADAAKKEAADPSNPYGSDANGWENSTIEAFLGAAIAWAEASDFGRRQGVSLDNQWKSFALFLYCGKTYE